MISARLNITRKFLLYLLFSSILPIVLVGSISYQISRSVVEGEVRNSMRKLARIDRDYLDLLFQGIESLIGNIAASRQLLDLIAETDRARDGYTQLSIRSRIGDILSRYTQLSGLISIDIITTKGMRHHIGDHLISGSEVDDRAVAELMESANRPLAPPLWASIGKNINLGSIHKQVVTVVRVLQSSEKEGAHSSAVGHIMISYDVAHYRRLVEANADEDIISVIVDSGGYIVYHPDPARIGQRLTTSFRRRLEHPQAEFTLVLDGRETYVSYSKSRRSGWVVLTLTPTATFTDKVTKIRDSALVVSVLLLLFIAVLAYFVSARMVTPVTRITQAFKRLQQGHITPDLHLPPDRAGSADEIGELVKWYNLFLDNLVAKHQAEELMRDKERAESASRAKGEFLAHMSHEIRTPLNGIMGMTDVVLMTNLDAEQTKYIHTIKDSSALLLNVLDDILDFSKVEAGKLDLVYEPFWLRRRINEIMQMMALRCHQKGLELITNIDRNVPDLVVGDDARLAQVLINLVGNAVKFTERGEIEVRIQVESREQDALVALFSVRDTGIGIPDDKQKLIFAPFSQADASITRSYGGTGLGLAISSRLVELMGGRIWVESEVSKGATFCFTTRLGLREDSVEPKAPKEALALRNVPIFIVEHHPKVAAILAHTATEAWGMRATTAAGRVAALPLIEELVRTGGRPVVLADVSTPGSDNWALIDELQVRFQRFVRIIVMTAHRGKPDSDEYRSHNIEHVLTKPVREDELLATLLRIIGAASDGAKQVLRVDHDAESGALPSARILLVEDNVINQRVARELLMRQGHEVVIANNGDEALQVLGSDKQGFHLVLMDLQMPKMDGLATTKVIRAREAGRSTRMPIVALTAHALKGEQERCLQSGMDGYMAKPLSPKALFQMVATMRSATPIHLCDEASSMAPALEEHRG